MNTKKSNFKEKTYGIKAGPCKDLLFDACKYAYNKSSNVVVDFHINDDTVDEWDGGVIVPARDFTIAGIEYEDGSGYKFNLHGYCRADLNGRANESRVYAPYQFEAFYNTQTRQGQITFLV